MLTSKYNFKAGFLLMVVLNLLWIIFFVINPNKLNSFNLYLLGMYQLLMLVLFMKECRIIKIDHEKIVYINPILPFFKKTRYFHDYDYFHIVQEYSRGKSYETIWLIKDRVLEDRISSFYYSNCSEMKRSIKVKNKGPLNINSFKQLACRFGMEI